jgi:hypothetical protein
MEQMLQRLGDHIAACLQLAAAAEQRAAEATDPRLRVDNERMAASWRHLARSYEFVESLERFLLDAERVKAPQPKAPAAD